MNINMTCHVRVGGVTRNRTNHALHETQVPKEQLQPAHLRAFTTADSGLVLCLFCLRRQPHACSAFMAWRKKEADDGASAKRGLDASRDKLSSVASHVSDGVTRAFVSLMEHFPEPGPEWIEAESKIRSALDGVLPNTMAIATELWEGDAEQQKKMLQQQKTTYEIKLETARSAARSQLANQHAELEGAYHKKLESKLEEAGGGANALLKEAHAKIEELQKIIDKNNKCEHSVALSPDRALAISLSLSTLVFGHDHTL